MLLFLVPLKSSKISNSWDKTCRLLERALKSMCAQTSADFRVLVVCHEQPDLEFQHPQIEFLSVDFPAPNPINYEDKYPMREARRDKHRKVLTGLLHSHQHPPSHVMLVDADDLVSNSLAAFVSQNKTEPGWYIEKGFEYFEGSGQMFPITERFYGKCGSSHIVRFDILEKIAQTTSIEEIHHRFLHHQDVRKFVDQQGFSLSPLPFPGAVYITNHGDNMWASQGTLLKRYGQTPQAFISFHIRKLIKGILSKKKDADLIKEYGLYDLAS